MGLWLSSFWFSAVWAVRGFRVSGDGGVLWGRDPKNPVEGLPSPPPPSDAQSSTMP